MNDSALNNAIINPIKGKSAPNLGPVAVMVASKDDLSMLCNIMGLQKRSYRTLLMSRIYFGNDSGKSYSIVGPLVGAPYAVILLENLIAWGARKILFFGWCGAVSIQVKIGDIIVATAAIIDEGTSKHYAAGYIHLRESKTYEKANSLALAQNVDQVRNELPVSRPSAVMVKSAKDAFIRKGVGVKEGLVWSTDAIYRETPDKIAFFQKKKVLAVEMETSALFTVGRFRKVDVGAILVVSDELSSFTWRPGFLEKPFIECRRTVVEVIHRLCKNL